MEADFWHQRWEQREIGFHQAEVNRFLRQYWPLLGLDNSSSVLVPLCGKSKDMVWLAQRGHQVIGVELSETAVREFFDEQAVTPQIDTLGSFTRYSAANITLLAGDFFALPADYLASVAAVYDRASLIALPPGMRDDYAALLTRLLPPKVKTLLITFEYRPGAAEGPPFSIDENEVRRLFSHRCDIEALDSQYFDLRGVDSTEHVFRLIYR